MLCKLDLCSFYYFFATKENPPYFPGRIDQVLRGITCFEHSLPVQRICYTITMLGGINVPYFVWFGILGLLLLYAAGIVMFLAKRKGKVHLRRYHPLLGSAAALSLAVHAVWANISHFGRSLPLLGWLGLLAAAAVCVGYYAMSRAQRGGDRIWRSIHWQVELGALIAASVHALWFLTRILGS
jgi:hypothetical protein